MFCEFLEGYFARVEFSFNFLKFYLNLCNKAENLTIITQTLTIIAWLSNYFLFAFKV